MTTSRFHARSLVAVGIAAAIGLTACDTTAGSPSSSPAAAGSAAAAGVAPKAAFEQLTGVSTTVDLDAGTVAVLTKNGVSVAPVAPATALTDNGGPAVSFPITDGFVSLYDQSQAPFVRGTFSHSGGLTFSAGGKSITVTDFIVNPGTSILTATVGGKGVPLLDLNGSKVQISNDAQGQVHLDGTVASLTQTAADALNQTFGVSLFQKGIVVGVVHIVATGKASPGGIPSAEVMQLAGDSTTVNVDAGTAAALQQNGVTVSPVGSATASTTGGGLAVTFPITNGYVALYSALPTVRGLVTHSGGLMFSAGGKSLTVTDFIINPGTSELMATVGGSGKVVPLLDLDGSKVQISNSADGKVHLDGTVATLSQTAADALNATFGVTLFKAGIPLGIAHIVASAAS